MTERIFTKQDMIGCIIFVFVMAVVASSMLYSVILPGPTDINDAIFYLMLDESQKDLVKTQFDSGKMVKIGLFSGYLIPLDCSLDRDKALLWKERQ